MIRKQRSPRGPGYVYAAITLALIVIVTVIALTTRQTPPPTIAEFAPQAIEQIKDAPTEQSSEFGSGEGGSGLQGFSPPPQASPPPRQVVDLPRVRRCVGDPPRQIEDPQSPPCVPYYAGDNGGSTSHGVTRDSINIFIPTEGSRKADTYDPLMKFLNKRFEFYGRKLVFIYDQDGIGTAQPESQKASATKAKTEAKAFASSFYRASQGLHYHEELSRLGVINATGVLSPFPREYLRNFQPYMWQYYMESDQILANLGEWACRRLVGRKAEFGGDAVKGSTRVFGVIVQTYYDRDPTNSEELVREMSRCGYSIPKERDVRNGVRNDQGGETTQTAAIDPVTSTNVILQMKGNDVTTIFCPCNLFTVGALAKAATNQNYFPEWVFTSYGPMDINVAPTLGNTPPEQMAHAMAVSFQPKQVPLAQQPFWWAIKEGDPGVSMSSDSASVLNRAEIYWPILILASGIQMAGPELTPETFASGLQRTRFPNPEHPNMAGKVGFNGGRFAMTLDAAELWWSNGARSPYQGDSGAYCYVAGGKRYSKGTWLSGESSLFKPPCDTGA